MASMTEECKACKSGSNDGPMGQMGLFAFAYYETYQADRQEVVSE